MKKMERRKFLGSTVGVIGIAGLNFSNLSNSISAPNVLDEQEKTIKLKGKQDTLVTHWDVITIGNLSRNRYWGESDEKPIHSAICTCTVISGKDFHLIVDPSLADEATMLNELTRRTGLTPDKIDVVFITHQHEDHTAGLKHFQKAKWIAGREVASAINKSGTFVKKIEVAGEKLFETIDVISTPGHTPDHKSLRFDYKGLSIVIAGDSVATRDFWDERRSYYNVVNNEEAKATMEKINKMADIIVPGHDNNFFNL